MALFDYMLIEKEEEPSIIKNYFFAWDKDIRKHEIYVDLYV